MTEQQIDFTVALAGERLDKLVVEQVGDSLSRAQIQAMIKDGKVTVNGLQVKSGVKLKGGEQISVTIETRDETETVQPEAIPLVVVHDDPDFAVIDKPAGMTVHPGVGNEKGTLVSALLSRWPEVAKMNIVEKRVGIVHRLDKDTSGLILIAKNDAARIKLQAQFQARTVSKVYIALVEKMPATVTGVIEAPIGRDPNQRKRMAVLRGGKPAVTEYQVIDHHFIGDQALVRVTLHTGRTHQIRVHMAFIGSPIVGDSVYGFRKQRIKLKRQFLHAAELSFDHPTTGERLKFESALPVGLQNTLDKLRG
ncbi:MAG: RluA family pseudouridine synthase [Chloroflexota bacterium]|nr:RluA family pseudouridine synthase [Anaerolineae bacterium]